MKNKQIFAIFSTIFLCLACPMRGAAVDHRAFTIGDMEIIALADVDADRGGQNRPELLVGLSGPDAGKYLVPGAMKNSINAFLVKMDGKNILFDTGLGAAAGGRVAASLAAAGVDPEQIDVVCITHFHPDHVGGLLKEGKPVFATSRLLVPRLEVEKNAQGASTFLAAYADGLLAFEFGQEVFPGITALDARGHTPGHTAFLLESGGGRLLIVADSIHFPGIQLPLPEVAVTYDSDPAQAVAARRMLFDKAIAEKLPIAAMHIPFPGMGWLGREGTGYAFREME